MTRGAIVAALATGVAAAGMVFLLDPAIGAITAVPMIFAAVLAAIDHVTALITNRNNFILAAITVATVLGAVTLAGRGSLTGAAAGAAVWGVPLFITALTGGTGGGDFKYAASLGTLAGWVSILAATVGLCAALLAASLQAAIHMIQHRTTRTQIRLGPTLYSGAVLALVLHAAQIVQ